MEERDQLKALVEGGPANLTHIITSRLRMSVVNAQGLREATGSIYRSFIIKTKNPIMEAATKAATTYHEKTEAIKHNHKEDMATQTKSWSSWGRHSCMCG